MKTPLAICDISDFGEEKPGMKSGTRIGDFEVPNVRVQGWKLMEQLENTLVDGQSMRLYSDGITGRVIIE